MSYWTEHEKEDKFRNLVMAVLKEEYQPRRQMSFKYYYKSVKFKLINDSIAKQIIEYCIDNYNNMPTPSQFHDAVDAVFPRERIGMKDYDLDSRDTENKNCSGCGKSWDEVEKYDEYLCVHCNIRANPNLGIIQKERAERIFKDIKSTKVQIRWAKRVTGQEIADDDYGSEEYLIQGKLEKLIHKVRNNIDKVSESDVKSMEKYKTELPVLEEDDLPF